MVLLHQFAGDKSILIKKRPLRPFFSLIQCARCINLYLSTTFKVLFYVMTLMWPSACSVLTQRSRTITKECSNAFQDPNRGREPKGTALEAKAYVRSDNAHQIANY